MPAWQKGQSGNPSGRKPKGRALTEILQKAGASTVIVNGEKITGKRLVAQLLWQIATTGKARFPDGRALEIAPQDWLAIVKFLYQHIDGPPKAELEVTGKDGGPVELSIVKGYTTVTPDDWDNDPGSVEQAPHTTDSDLPPPAVAS